MPNFLSTYLPRLTRQRADAYPGQGVVRMSLQFNVSSLSQEDVGAVREHAVDSRSFMVDEASRSHIAGDVSMLRTSDGILVTSVLIGTQDEQCSLCLKQIKVPLQLNIQEEFFASVDAVSEAALPAPEDPDAFRISPNHVLDLEEAVRQSWLSALPMQPLCNPDCAGLCSECGKDLNQGSCSCAPAQDERWAALQELAREMKGT